MKIDYQNLLTHFIFSTLHHQPVIPEENRDRIEKYITGIVNNNNCKLYAIYINPDHMHLFVSRDSAISEEQLSTIVEESSNKFINKNNLTIDYFEWQKSAAAFSISKYDINNVCKYILNQKEHHKTISFDTEFREFIKIYRLQMPNNKLG